MLKYFSSHFFFSKISCVGNIGKYEIWFNFIITVTRYVFLKKSFQQIKVKTVDSLLPTFCLLQSAWREKWKVPLIFQLFLRACLILHSLSILGQRKYSINLNHTRPFFHLFLWLWYWTLIEIVFLRGRLDWKWQTIAFTFTYCKVCHWLRN